MFIGKEMVDYIADYLETIRDRRVFPDVKPGYMRELLNDTAPMEGEEWDDIFKDVERVIMPGVSKINLVSWCNIPTKNIKITFNGEGFYQKIYSYGGAKLAKNLFIYFSR